MEGYVCQCSVYGVVGICGVVCVGVMCGGVWRGDVWGCVEGCAGVLYGGVCVEQYERVQ